MNTITLSPSSISLFIDCPRCFWLDGSNHQIHHHMRHCAEHKIPLEEVEKQPEREDEDN